jgi:hypothetical protein
MGVVAPSADRQVFGSEQIIFGRRQTGQPLLALLRIVGEQMATVRRDMDALWDDFFMESISKRGLIRTVLP